MSVRICAASSPGATSCAVGHQAGQGSRQGRNVRARRRFEAPGHAARDQGRRRARSPRRMAGRGRLAADPVLEHHRRYNGFEAARRNGVKRVVFASSNHAVGFYRRDETIDHRGAEARQPLRRVQGVRRGARRALCAQVRPRVSCIRIGNVNPEPLDKRRLAIWVSPRDIAQLVAIGIDHPDVKFEIVYGVSDNHRAWYDNSNAYRLGYRPMTRARRTRRASSPSTRTTPTRS